MFGVAATRPDEVAQNIPKMAEHLDYVSAMVYPSHWAPGEYGVADPNGEPYEIVQRSLEDFKKDVRGTGARVVPWLQDFSLGVHYGPAQVAAQIQAAKDDGIDEYLLWDPLVTYTGAALTPDARTAVFSKPKTPAELAKSLKPNELGLVPVLMHHQIRAHGSVYDMTAAQLHSELTRLWQDGFYPITAADLVAGRIDVPKGRSPVVLTFDDATNNQVAFRPDGSLDPSSGLGVLEAFAKTHHDFPAAATFYVPRNAFDGNGRTPASTLSLARRARLRARQPHEGPHPAEHARPRSGPAAARARQPGAQRPAPGLRADDDGAAARLPAAADLAGDRGGAGAASSYSFAGVFLAGAEPAPSPFSTKWDPGADPADPDEPELERHARLHRRDVARPARAEPGPAVCLGRQHGDDRLPARARVGARAGVPGSREAVLSRGQESPSL